MSFTKFRDTVAEIKIQVSRAQSYIGILNFLLIFAIFLNTTAWAYDPIQAVFSSKTTFLLIGFAFILSFIFVLGYFDTKFKFYEAESMHTFRPGRSPHFIPQAFQCAKHLNELKAKGVDTSQLESKLNDMFKKCGLDKEFEFFKESTKLK
ncbi:MAG TPA: hypothetical protein VJ110_01360 [Candidatus Nanoarchaeia archaeon]|nr:hypothetical protein [Candidatus Nanoarchaeia archaeon]